MKINNFDVECELAFDEDGILTGWFETPALPHVRYTLEIDAREVAEPFEPPEFEEVIEGEVEQVLLPDNTVADVTPQRSEVQKTAIATAAANDDKPTD